MKRIALSIAIIFIHLVSTGQGFQNYGANITIEQEAFIHTGDYLNDEGSSIDLDGELEISGNWTNHASGDVFINIEETPDGWLSMRGNDSVFIGGSQACTFENIHLNQAYQTLTISDNKVEGKLKLGGVFVLQAHSIQLLNPLPEALLHESGYILSESLPVNGTGDIIWQIGENTGSYHIPFGDGTSNNPNIAINLNIIKSGISAMGQFVFASYPTNADNQPLPENVSVPENPGPLNCIDRLWKAEALYTVNPDVSIEFSYSTNDTNPTENPGLDEDSLSVLQFHRGDMRWEQYNSYINTGGIVGMTELQGNRLFGWFTLGSVFQESITDLTIPNGITPNGDGYNDSWIIDGLNLPEVWIYNRWGNEVFYSKQYDNSFDGKNLPSGPYYYVINTNGEILKGDLNILH
jgi:gliding motility-associated-like protein